MIVLNCVSHAVAAREVFSGVSISFDVTKKYGLVGPNGVGKSTLAKLISGVLLPTHGQIHRSVAVSYLPQTEPRPNISLGEFLAYIWEQQRDGDALVWELVQSLNFDSSLSELSGGEWMRARLACLIAKQPEFIILDEPTNDLDSSARDLLLSFVKNFSKGILLISHDRTLLRAVNAIIELSNQGATKYGGNFDFYWDTRLNERDRQSRMLAQLKRSADKAKRDTQTRTEQRARSAKLGKTRLIQRGASRLELQGKKRTAQVTTGRLTSEADARTVASYQQFQECWLDTKLDPFIRLDFQGAKPPTAKAMLTLSEFSWHFAGSSTPLWNPPITWQLVGPERCAIRGANGTGKSTLAKLIAGRPLSGEGSASGDLKVGTAAIAYLDQDYGALDPELSIIANIESNSRFSTVELRNELAFYGFTGEMVSQKVSTLSGGERLKASLAQMFLGPTLPELLILDEPTNNLDLQGIELLQRAIEAYCGAVLVISHDEEFMQGVRVTQVLEL